MPRAASVRRALGALLVGAIANALVACGGDEPPAEAVPALADRLERVDAAITDERNDRARRAVEALVDEATRARMDGSITADQADEIIRAAAELLDQLGTESGGDRPDPTDPATPAPPADTPDLDETDEPEGDGEGRDDDDEGNGKGKGEGNGKGNGRSEGNGPDDVQED